MSEHNQVMAPPGVILSIFTEEDGRPMVFYIDPVDQERDKYIKLIHAAGGAVETDGRVLENGRVVQLSSYAWDDRITVSFRFIDDSLKKGSMCFIDQYRVMPGLVKKRINQYDESMDAADAVAHALVKKKMSKTTTKFTPEADKFILEQVRLKPRFRTSHKFFEELSHNELLRGHTGNSVRSRFRAHLEHRLDYVWKTDEYDNLVLDHEGRQIAISTNQAKTIKNRFTAEDDYNLCRDVIEHVLNNQDAEQLKSPDGAYLEYPLNENKFSVLIVFFDEYARHHPQHSSSSWRDRYRKFARVYGLQKYRDYYLREKDSKEGPQPMKNLTSRASKEKKKIENNVRRMKKVQDDAEVAAAAAVAAVATNGHLLGHAPHHHHHHHHLPPLAHSQMDANAAAAVANLAVSARDASALEEEMSDVKNSNIHEALRNVGAEAGRVNIEDDMVNTGVRALAGMHPETDESAIHPNLGGTGGVSDHDEFDLELKAEPDSQDVFVKEIEYMHEDAEVDDLFNSNFYNQKPKDALSNVEKVLKATGPEDLGRLFQELESIGLQRRFTGHVFKVTGADVRYVHKLLAQIFRGMDHHTPLDELLFPRKQNGMWIQEYDIYLRKGELSNLQFQTEQSIERRRVFLGLDE